jgi:hypothetical protein
MSSQHSVSHNLGDHDMKHNDTDAKNKLKIKYWSPMRKKKLITDGNQ